MIFSTLSWIIVISWVLSSSQNDGLVHLGTCSDLHEILEHLKMVTQCNHCRIEILFWCTQMRGTWSQHLGQSVNKRKKRATYSWILSKNYDNFGMTLACKQQTSCLLRFHLLICTRGLSASKGDCTVHFLKIGTLSSEDGDGSENITEKVNLRSFNLYCDYSKSLTLSNVGEPS